MASGIKPSFASTTVGLAVGVTAAVVLACAGGAYLYSRHHMQSLLEMARAAALSEGNLIRVALEHQMIENDRTLIAGMIESFRKQSRVERLVVLDRAGVERYPAGGGATGSEWQIDSPTCQACHRYPADQRGDSRVIETRSGQVLRTVIPIRNRAECFGCHDPRHKINGILILDYRTDRLSEAMSHDLRWLVGGTAAITLLLVGAIGLVIRVAVLRRLQRFETAARRIADGDLGQRVPAGGTDTISWLAREFNTMADSVTGLVGEVRNQRERLETVINSIDDGIVVLDPGRHVIAANDAFLLRAQHSREEVLGCQCREFTPGGCTVTDCPTLSCLQSGARQVRICERRSPEGRAVWEEVHASPILDSSGRLQQVVEVWRDISDRRAAEARLAESHRLASVGTLASGFSHELNTPLATVLTCVEGILRENDTAQIHETASIAREQILRCRGITQHFLRMSRGQRSQGEVVDLAAVIGAVSRLIEPTAREQMVSIEVRPLPAGLHVRAEEAELQHTLINLLLNAVQASWPGTRVTVEAEAGEQVRVRIVDTGCGIALEDQKRIFEPFVSARKGGTGLGLFLSLNFVRRWNGDLRVTSEPGRGSTFEIVLPALVRA
ncbi:MAG TPA: ATP-binding protein [Bryobacteraceae bacterium]|nr:ATP-binding protein [Bryobacteraceae bacterium]